MKLYGNTAKCRMLLPTKSNLENMGLTYIKKNTGLPEREF